MGKREQKRKLIGPWRNLHGAIWLIGLAILAWQGWWWPGILVLVAISLLLEAVLMRYAPQAFEEVEPPPSPTSATAPLPELPPSPTSAAAPPMPPSPAPSASEHRFDLLPSACPKCGGPLRGHEVNWTGPQSADCPYCGANLPMATG